MKKILIMLLVVAVSLSVTPQVYASDWDKAGIALTGIEGLRIITGGKVDIVGSMFGIKGERNKTQYVRYKKCHHHKYENYDCAERTWVPHYRWKKKYISEQEKYSEKYGKIIVEGHYIKYRVKKGGHWETKYSCLY